jgi:hypothetical protein
MLAFTPTKPCRACLPRASLGLYRLCLPQLRESQKYSKVCGEGTLQGRECLASVQKVTACHGCVEQMPTRRRRPTGSHRCHRPVCASVCQVPHAEDRPEQTRRTGHAAYQGLREPRQGSLDRSPCHRTWHGSTPEARAVLSDLPQVVCHLRLAERESGAACLAFYWL